MHAKSSDPRRQPCGVSGARAAVRRDVPDERGGAVSGLSLHDGHCQDRARGLRRDAGELLARRGAVSGGGEGAGERGRERGGGESAVAASAGQGDAGAVGEEDQPRRERGGGMAAVRRGRGDRRGVHGE